METGIRPEASTDTSTEPKIITPFAEMGLSAPILSALEKIGYKDASPVQVQAIPLILEGKDIIALAPTGSGKTAACAIPICEKVIPEEKGIQALIVVPTRELALQYATETQKIGSHKGVKTFAICGGEDAALQKSKLAHGVHVLVATPGRLIDFIYSQSIDLSSVRTLILDEADEMLNLGFYEDLEFIIQCVNHKHQTLLFSATMPKQIREIAQKHMHEPEDITLIQKAVPENIHHKFLFCAHHTREVNLLQLLKDIDPKQAIVFCHSRHQVESVCQVLKKSYSGVDYLHAGLSQDLRSTITSKFRQGRIRCLVATDVVARGLDFSGVTHVFIYQLSDDPDIYVHRAGRTGRYERAGTVVTLVTKREIPALRKILKKLHKEVTWIGQPPKL